MSAGMWWLPAAGEALIGTLRNAPAAAGGANGSLANIAGGDEEAARLLSLAAAQRMSTDVRRAVFMAVMGSEDAGEAFERLTRLPLKVGLLQRLWTSRACSWGRGGIPGSRDVVCTIMGSCRAGACDGHWRMLRALELLDS